MPRAITPYYPQGRTEVPSHVLGLYVDQLYGALYNDDERNPIDQSMYVVAYADDVQRYINAAGRLMALPEGLQAIADVLVITHTPGRYQWFAYDFDSGEWLYDENGDRIAVPNGNVEGALEDYISASVSWGLSGPLPPRPTSRQHSRYNACEACQELYNAASPQQRTAIEGREHTSGRISFSYSRDETDLVNELVAYGNRHSDPGLPSEALANALSQYITADHYWHLARMLILNQDILDPGGHELRMVVRGQLEDIERFQHEIDNGFRSEILWRCYRCMQWTTTYECEYRSTSGSTDVACDYCVSNMSYCDSCDHSYAGDYCANCEEPEEDEDSYSYGRGPIHDYSYQPSTEFWGDGPLYFGIELETEVQRGSVNACAQSVISLSDSEQRFYLKHDGSISNGFELVTHPFDLDDWHAYSDEFSSVLAAASKLGARAWNQSRCGLHVHASRNGLRSDSRTAREAHLYRIVKLVEDNALPISKFAGRLSDQWATYSKESRGVPKLEAVKMRPNGEPDYRQNRYQAVNLLPSKTIEFRLFRPSLNPVTVLAAVELCHGIISHTARLSANECISGGLQFPALAKYMEARPETYPNALVKISTRVNTDRPADDSDKD